MVSVGMVVCTCGVVPFPIGILFAVHENTGVAPSLVKIGVMVIGVPAWIAQNVSLVPAADDTVKAEITGALVAAPTLSTFTVVACCDTHSEVLYLTNIV